MKEITKELLEDLYYKQKKSYREIKSVLGISRKNLIRLINKFNLQKDVSEVIENRKETCLERYGETSWSKTKEGKETLSQKVKESRADGKWLEKFKQTCLERYGEDNYAKTEEYKQKFKQTCLEKYNVEHPFKLEEVKNKRYQTMIKNNSFCCGISKAEEQAYQLLLTKFPAEDIERQYKSELYPFKCDFYIKSLDLYIEYNGGQYHYKDPFDKNNPRHIERLNKLKKKNFEYRSEQKTVYTAMIKVWTESDPLKRETVNKNNLNWLEFFNLDQLQSWLLNEN